MIYNFKLFLENLIIEELHPDLKSIVSSSNINNKQVALAKKVKELSDKGEKTGIEGNMPKGSSRAYLRHDEPHNIILDGKVSSIRSGTKVAIKAELDKFHNRNNHDGLSLGAMQNRAENNDHLVNSHHRILTEDHESGANHFKTNEDNGIFPPLFHHDHVNHQYSHVGHVEDIKSSEFKKMTKTKSHPQGITHSDFVSALIRHHDRNNGKYWGRGEEKEKHLDHVESHPLVQKFLDYHTNFGAPPHDYAQIKNMGVFVHPNGSRHIVARDHGFDTEVAHAYVTARKRKFFR